MTPTRRQLGAMLKEAREAKSLTLRAAAEKLGIGAPYLSRIESGEYALGKHARAVAKLYGLDPESVEAMASVKLPKYAPYLRAQFDLSDDEIAELERHFAAVTGKNPSKRGRS